jgi:hypothetical protein
LFREHSLESIKLSVLFRKRGMLIILLIKVYVVGDTTVYKKQISSLTLPIPLPILVSKKGDS